MSIKKIIKLNLFIVSSFLIIIFIANYYASKKTEIINKYRQDITALVFLQENMNNLIFDTIIAKRVNALNILKKHFDEKTKIFEQISALVKEDKSGDFFQVFYSNIILNKTIKRDLSLLFENKKEIEQTFLVLIQLQEQKINLTKNFDTTYPLEKKIRKQIKAKILALKNIELTMIFNASKYYSKEALFQYKDEKHFKEWINEVLLLKSRTNIAEFDQYLDVIETLGNDIFELNELKKIELIFIENIKRIRLENNILNNRINENADNWIDSLNSSLNNMTMLLMLFVLINILLLGYKVYTNIGYSVDEMDAKVAEEVEKNRAKDEILSHQSKLASMGEMMGNIAHQWRQPLSALAGNIQFLKDDFEDGIIDKNFVDDFVKRNMSFINFMSKTIDDFRDFFKSDKTKKEFSILTALKQPIDILKPQFDERKILIKQSGDDFTMFELQSELEQVILNILNNARDALLENKVESPYIKIETIKNENVGLILIEDNAGGIPQDVINKIFEPYFTTKEEGKGTGIGLYMSNRIINNMQGKLSVSNNSNGALFEIELKII